MPPSQGHKKYVQHNIIVTVYAYLEQTLIQALFDFEFVTGRSLIPFSTCMILRQLIGGCVNIDNLFLTCPSKRFDVNYMHMLIGIVRIFLLVSNTISQEYIT